MYALEKIKGKFLILETYAKSWQEFLQKKRDLIEMAERVVLINLRFDTNVNHPYRPLHDAMKLLGVNSKELRREVWKLVGCWYLPPPPPTLKKRKIK